MSDLREGRGYTKPPGDGTPPFSKETPVIRRTAPFALVALALVAAPAAFAKDKFPLEVKVKNEEGKPVEGALVQITAASGDAFAVSGATDRKGRYEAALPDFARAYRLQVSMAGFATVERLLDLPAQNLKPNRTVDVDVALRVRTAADAYNDAAKALQKRDLATGLARLEEATRMKPDFVEAWRALAQVYLAADRPADALAAADRTLQLVANDGTALRDRYDALTALSRAEEAEASLETLATQDRSPETARLLFNSGAAAWNAKNAVLARQRLGQALAIDPALHQAHSALAEIHIAEAQTAEADADKKRLLTEAVADLDRALAVAPRNFKAWQRKIEVLKAMGDTVAAEAAEKKVAELKAGG
jgi:tetratricopeptide (TPR) repeat protein